MKLTTKGTMAARRNVPAPTSRGPTTLATQWISAHGWASKAPRQRILKQWCTNGGGHWVQNPSQTRAAELFVNVFEQKDVIDNKKCGPDTPRDSGGRATAAPCHRRPP